MKNNRIIDTILYNHKSNIIFNNTITYWNVLTIKRNHSKSLKSMRLNSQFINAQSCNYFYRYDLA